MKQAFLRSDLPSKTGLVWIVNGRVLIRPPVLTATFTANLFRDAPPEFLRMIVVHELAHLKEPEHDKAFYQLCCHMAPDYAQLELDVRLYLTHLDAAGAPLWTP